MPSRYRRYTANAELARIDRMDRVDHMGIDRMGMDRIVHIRHRYECGATLPLASRYDRRALARPSRMVPTRLQMRNPARAPARAPMRPAVPSPRVAAPGGTARAGA